MFCGSTRKMDFSVNAVVFILLIIVLFGCAQLDAERVLLQRLRRQTTTAKPALKVTDYHVRCAVVSHYALTTVESTVWNQLHINKEAAFEVDLSPAAFISNFTITSNGKVYVAEVKRRTAARKIYDNAKKQGKTAGLVATKEREIEKFRVAVSVPPGARVSFSLSYEELLSRRLGHYELTLGLRPGQPVQNLSLDVSISERTGISFIRALPLRTSRLLTNNVHAEAEPPPSTQVKQNPHCVHVHYTPTIQQQRNISSRGLSADFIIQYDVDLKDPIGDIQVDDGYFVHYFAPRGLPVVPKDVIFVIDISGSMIGTKIKQTKAAMTTILSDLREGDYFNLITFSDKVHTWKKGRTVRATRQNVRDAKEFVRKIMAEGWTNINAALLSAAQLLNPSSHLSSLTGHAPTSHRVPMIIFLTDGEATIGVTEPDVILSNAQKALGLASLFGLAFGDDADFPLLRRLAMENRGVARMVYEDDDAAVQLKGFYDEVASPLLSDIQLSYLDDQAYDITRSLFPNYFQGSELVVTGRLKPGVQDLKVTLTANDSKQKVRVESELPLAKAVVNGTVPSPGCAHAVDGIPSFVNRLWAYFTIKELLLAKINTTDIVTQRLLVDKATNLSLKYNFVTPVTSLVVIKPDTDEPEPTISSTVMATTTTSKTATTTIASSTNMTNQTSHAALKISSTSAMGTKKSNSTTALKTSKPLVTKSVRPHPPPLGLHTTGQPPNTSLSLDKTASRSPKKTTTVPPKTISTSLSSKPTSSPPSIIKTTSSSGLVRNTLLPPPKNSTTPPSTEKTTSSSQPAKTTTLATLVKTLPSVLKDSSLTDIENSTTSELTSLHQGLQTLSSTTALTTDTNSDFDPEVAMLLAPTFMPMPGMTDAPKLWEASRILDVSSTIQIQRKDIELVKDYDAEHDHDHDYDYDYNIHYDSYSDAQVAADPDSPASLSTVRGFSSSVDGDPHFVVQLPKLHQNLCFTIDGKADDVLRLLEDPEKGIIVDGHLMLAQSKEGMENRVRTFFDRITITANKGFMITLTLNSVLVEVEGEGLELLPTNQRGSVKRQGLRVKVDEHHSCWIELGRGVQFLILFHRYSHPKYFQVKHLGFYIADGSGLSHLSQGLLGQFQHTHLEVTRVTDRAGFHHAQTNKNSLLVMGLLKKGDEHFPVTLQDKILKDSSRKRHSAQCWVVPKVDVERLLGNSYQSYIVDHQQITPQL
ncbi:inter-alpha-trypsin inhibitor heavy chain H6-like isoform X3 [Myxocyprinus asiaticus]|uniref:inter-alpha-trypsin inhibitor heavy chain H6-like isoform X3 n=1 Tax=Myxocyprinus asiaticus TaxID=70543 RepID=UPI00222161BF|nr:inter-alpha-trypsin inhibitor heavy chain H6-like isoform X3 [Myxocyprinus asiaticus]